MAASVMMMLETCPEGKGVSVGWRPRDGVLARQLALLPAHWNPYHERHPVGGRGTRLQGHAAEVESGHRGLHAAHGGMCGSHWRGEGGVPGDEPSLLKVGLRRLPPGRGLGRIVLGSRRREGGEGRGHVGRRMLRGSGPLRVHRGSQRGGSTRGRLLVVRPGELQEEERKGEEGVGEKGMGQRKMTGKKRGAGGRPERRRTAQSNTLTNTHWRSQQQEKVGGRPKEQKKERHEDEKKIAEKERHMHSTRKGRQNERECSQSEGREEEETRVE